MLVGYNDREKSHLVSCNDRGVEIQVHTFRISYSEYGIYHVVTKVYFKNYYTVKWNE